MQKKPRLNFFLMTVAAIIGWTLVIGTSSATPWLMT